MSRLTPIAFAAVALAASLSLAACDTLGKPPPSAPVSAQVAHDKQGLLVEVSYQTLETVIESLVDSGHLHGKTAVEVGRLERAAWDAVLAYRAASSTSDRSAQVQALVDVSLKVVADLSADPGLTPQQADQIKALAVVIDALATSLKGGAV